MDETTKEEPIQERKGPGTSTLIKAVVVIGLIVVLECAVASTFLPSAEDTEAVGRKVATAAAGEMDDGVLQENGNSTQLDLREVNLGRYYVTSYQPESNTTLRIDFELFATVLASDEVEFQLLYEQHQHRFSEQVHVTFRGASLTDLTDAGLGLIKRRILEKSNRTLGKPLVHEVIFSQFSFVEQ